MYYLLDTNVISDRTKPRPEPKVTEWVDGIPPEHLALSTITMGEILKGVLKLHPGPRRATLAHWVEELPRSFRGHLLPIDLPIAQKWGEVEDNARRSGRALSVPDGLLVATAKVLGLVVVTRNERDFLGRGVDVVNPWNP